MDLEQHGDSSECKTSGISLIVWTNAMSSYVLAYLSQIMANGVRTSSGFKQVHLNSCAKALNEQLDVNVTGSQITNHLRKWRKLYQKYNKLRNLSAALWDDNTCTIKLDKYHYNDHVKDHKEDANFLNTPLEHYREMEIIFGNAMATGKYAKGGGETLAVDVIDLEKMDASKGTISDDGTVILGEGANGARTSGAHVATASGPNGEATTSHTTGGDSTGTKPTAKRVKTAIGDDLGYLMVNGLAKIAQAIEKSVAPQDDILKDLHDNLMSIPGFEGHLVHYYAYLCENSSQAKAFHGLSLSNKIILVNRYISKNF